MEVSTLEWRFSGVESDLRFVGRQAALELLLMDLWDQDQDYF